jgi:two-component system, NarL family, response regulator LiaR
MAASDSADAESRIGVLVVDDHDLFRTGLVRMLQVQPDIEVVAQASMGRMGVRLARELHPAVILMDLRLPDLDGIQATREIVRGDPAARVIVLTVAADEENVAAAVLAGARGYLVKDIPVDDVIGAIRAAAAGESWLSPRAATAVLDRMRREHVEPSGDPGATANLSPRELEILRLVARGMANAEIAAELNISPRTAKNHLSSVLSKLGVTNRVQAAIFAVRSGLD